MFSPYFVLNIMNNFLILNVHDAIIKNLKNNTYFFPMFIAFLSVHFGFNMFSVIDNVLVHLVHFCFGIRRTLTLLYTQVIWQTIYNLRQIR
jgi:hypothetical protein